MQTGSICFFLQTALRTPLISPNHCLRSRLGGSLVKLYGQECHVSSVTCCILSDACKFDIKYFVRWLKVWKSSLSGSKLTLEKKRVIFTKKPRIKSQFLLWKKTHLFPACQKPQLWEFIIVLEVCTGGFNIFGLLFFCQLQIIHHVKIATCKTVTFLICWKSWKKVSTCNSICLCGSMFICYYREKNNDVKSVKQ